MEQQYKVDENVIFKIKHIARTNMLFEVLKYGAVFMIVLALCLPLLNVNLLLGETSISFMDIILASNKSQTIKRDIAMEFAMDYFNIDSDNYKNFFHSIFVEPFTTLGVEKLNVKTFILQLVSYASVITFIIYSFISIICIIPCILKVNVEKAIRFSSKEKFDRAFAIRDRMYYFDKEENDKFFYSSISKKRFARWVVLTILFLIVFSYTVGSLILHVLKDRAITANFMLYVLLILGVLMLVIGMFGSRIYSEKYSGTLAGCNIIRKKNF